MERVQVISVKPIPSKDLPGTNPPLSLPNLKPPSLGIKKHSFSVRAVHSKSNFDIGKGRANDKTARLPQDGVLSHDFSELNLGSGVVPRSTSSCFGRSQLRASYHNKIQTIPLNSYYSSRGKRLVQEATDDFVYLKSINSGVGTGLYRSNSSLDLEHDTLDSKPHNFSPIKREYGSHGSININSKSFQPEDNLGSLLKNYREGAKPDTEVGGLSPKGKSKIHKLWDRDRSIFKKFRSTKNPEKCDKIETSSEISSTGSLNLVSNINAKLDVQEVECKMEEVQKYTRRSTLAHFDCLSLAAHLSATRIKGLLSDRSNTTTGASAAAMADSSSKSNDSNRSSREELSDSEGYGRNNHMIYSCPFFHNELGGDGERIVSLSRDISKPKTPPTADKPAQLYRTASASSIGLLEPPSGLSHWTTSLCPYANKSPTIEAIDQGSTFYSTYFQNKEHQNWFGIDEALGPTAISIRKEKQDESSFDKPHSIPLYQYRIIIRTSELFTCQGTLREETPRGEKAHKSLGVKEVLEYICPQLTTASCLRLGNSTPETEEALLRVDDLGIHKKFKVGVLYCKSGQRTEEDMYNNETAGPAFSEFLELLGQRVRLKDFDKYRGGLDKKTDSTGHYSVYTQYNSCEIMFHVSTLLPYTASNRKQLLRKRHIGNDIVTIVFQEPGAQPFSPKYIRSHFQHVFIVVQAINPCTENAMYSMAVSRFQDVPMFGPPIPEGATFPRSKKFTNFLLAKVINGELAALRSEKFSCMAARTKHEYLKDLATNHVTTTSLETSSKFSLKGFSRAGRKDKSRFKFAGDMSARGALSWSVILHDATLQDNVDCILGISTDSIVVFEESSASVVFATSTKSVLGWIQKPSGVMLFYHQGECLSISIRQTPCEEDEEVINEIVQRLLSVTQGAEAQELILRRNSANLLGFNVQQDGIITEVEPYGLAAQAGLQQGSRIVEICKVTLATLSQEQMVDLLKTSMTVSVTVIPPHKGGSPRRGCNVPTCSFLLGCSEGDYENLTPPEKNYPTKSKYKHSNRCERSFSPPRSATSSGYGTGSSSHSFSLDAQALQQDAADRIQADAGRGNEFTGTLSSTSSGHSNNFIDSEGPHHTRGQQKTRDEYTPPPLPARVYQDKSRHCRLGEQQLISNEKWKVPSGQVAHYMVPDQNNYAIPPNPRPVSYEFIDKKNISDGAVSDYDNGPTSHYDMLQLRYSIRRNSSPQPTLPKGHEEKLDTRLKPSGIVEQSMPAGYEPSLASKRSLCSRSEDDLSASSKSSSPYGFHRTNASSSSPSISRNQSPSQGLSLAPKDSAVLRLKASHGRVPARSSNSSNLQEELMRLINPDYLSDCDSLNTDLKERHASPFEDSRMSKESLDSRETSPPGIGQNKFQGVPYQTIGEKEFTSRKSVFNRVGDNPSQQSFRAQNHMLATVNAEGVVMTARPATVVSNSSGGSGHHLVHDNRETEPASLVSTRSKEQQRVSPGANEVSVVVKPQLEEEWNSLVHTATKAIEPRNSPADGEEECDPKDLNSNPENEGSVSSFGSVDSLRKRGKVPPNANALPGTDGHSLRNQSYYDSINSNADCSQVPECISTAQEIYSSRSSLDIDSNYGQGVRPQSNEPVQHLQHALAAEQHRSGQLEEEVLLLRNENLKLQEDSRAAAQQLHQFTEWFFNTIDKT